MNTESIPRIGLSEVIVDKLRQDVVSGRYRPGEKLPTHDELCRRWGVSRVTVREALHKLEAMGLVEVQQGRGTFIRRIDRPFFEKQLEFHLILDHHTIRQLLESRKVIETSLARFAAQRGEAEDFRRLEELIAEMEPAVEREDSLSYANVDFRFHKAIAAAARNDILLLMLEKIQTLIQAQQRNTFAYADAQGIHLIRVSFGDHRELVRQLAERNADGAARRMEAHIQRVEHVIESYYANHGRET